MLSSEQSYFETTSYALFTLISSSISIQDLSSIRQQNSLFNLFLSDTNIIDSTISDIDVLEPVMKVTSSRLNIIDTHFSGISDPSIYYFMLITLDSTLSINNLTFDDSDSNLFIARDAVIQIYGLIISNVTSFTDFIDISSSNHVNISQYSSINTSTDIEEQIIISDSNNIHLKNVYVSDTLELIIDIVNSNVTNLSNININN